jgi:hypothetical protein
MRYVFYQAGHKVARTVTNREDFLALRNSADNLSNLALARMGNAEAKAAADRVIEAKRRNGDLQALFRKYTSIYKTIGLDNI